MNDWDKQELYLQGAETYYYLNQVWLNNIIYLFIAMSRLISIPVMQGGACELRGKQDKQDFQLLIQCFETIGLRTDQVSIIWAVLSSILQLGNICFTSYEVWVSEQQKSINLKTNIIYISGVVSEWVLWGGSNLQWGWGQKGWFFVANFLWSSADSHYTPGHSE